MKIIKKILRLSPKIHTLLKNNYVRCNFYIFLSRRLKKQLSAAKNNSLNKPYLGKKVLVPLIETSHYQYHHLLGLAKVFQLRGADVKVIICGEMLEGCEIKSLITERDDDPCWTCRFNVKKIVSLYGLEVISLSDIVSQFQLDEISFVASKQTLVGPSISMHGLDLDQSITDSVIRYFYGAIPINSNKPLKVRQDHAKTAMISSEAAFQIDLNWGPDIVLSNMPCYSAWEPFYRYYDENGKRFRMISLSQFDFDRVTINLFDLFNSDDRYQNYKKYRNNTFLDDSEKKELNKFLSLRFAGKNEVFKKYKYYRKADQISIDKKLSIDKGKRNIFLFSNIYWDVGLSQNSALYNNVITWVLRTIELLKDRSDINLYIKPHPGEVYDSVGSLKGVGQIIKEKYPELPSNICIIEPEWKINTYDLFPYIDLGVIYTGTLGLEMMLKDIQVISTGKSTHHGLGFAAEPSDELKYLQLLLGLKNTPKYKKEELELFSYFYFLRSKIPWTLTKQAYSDSFSGFTFDNTDILQDGNDVHLDHLCSCIMNLENTVVEGWPKL